MTTRQALIDGIEKEKIVLKTLKKDFKKTNNSKLKSKINSSSRRLEKLQDTLNRKIRYSSWSRNRMLLNKLMLLSKKDEVVHNALMSVWSECEKTNPMLFLGVPKPKLKK